MLLVLVCGESPRSYQAASGCHLDTWGTQPAQQLWGRPGVAHDKRDTMDVLRKQQQQQHRNVQGTLQEHQLTDSDITARQAQTLDSSSQSREESHKGVVLR